MSEQAPLTPDQFRRTQQVFERLVVLSRREQEEFLTELRQAEPRIAKEIALLMAVEPTERLGPNDGLAAFSVRNLDPDNPDDHPDQIGPYRIVRPIGMGGMGIVYLAQQSEPVVREVAVKVIRWGMDSKAVAARFLAERQVLATLLHPGIASVFDAGTTEDGRPYFVMEYVNGQPLHHYCRAEKVDLRGRLEIFCDICDAVQHAHHKGVIHRDLKPSNLLVVPGAEDGDKPFVKIIDFGIAKSTSQTLLQETLYTQVGQLVGTPQYMSPEQASLGNTDVDTRSDVYSLGVVLYELLVGQSPFGGPGSEMSFDELLRAIRETEVVRPSSRIRRQTRADTQPQAERPDLPDSKELRGDLDWISLKALEKDRELRYDSAAALALDVRRHLNHEPVAAGPPNKMYRFRKFVRRHRVSVALASAVILAMVIGLISSSILLVRARTAEREAITSQERAEDTLGFVSELFKEADPRNNPGPDLTAKDLLQRGLEKVDEELEDQPEVRDAVLLTLGEVHRNMGLFDQAEATFRKLVRSLQQEREDPHLLVEALSGVARIHKERAELDQAETVLREAIALFDSTGSGDVRAHANLRSELGSVLNRADRTEEARTELLAALQLFQQEPEDPPLSVARTYNGLGVTAARMQDFEAAQEWMAQSLEILEVALEPGHASLSTLAMNLSYIYRLTGKLELAVEVASQAVDSTRAAVGDDNPLLADSLHNLGSAAMFLGNDTIAIRSFEEGTNILEQALGPDNDRTMFQLTGLGRSLQYSGRHSEALEVFDRVAQQKKNVSEHPDRIDHLASALRGKAIAARHIGQLDVSRDATEELIRLGQENAERRDVLAAGNLLLALLELLEGRPELAEQYYRQAHQDSDCEPGGIEDASCSLDGSTREVFRAQYWALRGDTERTLEFLAATLEQSPLTAWSWRSPEFQMLANDLRYTELVKTFKQRAR